MIERSCNGARVTLYQTLRHEALRKRELFARLFILAGGVLCVAEIKALVLRSAAFLPRGITPNMYFAIV